MERLAAIAACPLRGWTSVHIADLRLCLARRRRPWLTSGVQRIAALLVGLYAWLVTLALGATAFDIAAASAVVTSATPPPAEAADLMLSLMAVTTVAGLAAVGAAWPRRSARYLVAASIVVVAVGLFTPALLGSAIDAAQVSTGLRVGASVRLAEAGLASILAFVGLRAAWREG